MKKTVIGTWLLLAALAVGQGVRPPVDKFSRLVDVDTTGLSTNDVFYWNGTKFVRTATSAFGRTLWDDANAAALRTTIGAGTSSFDGVFASLSSKPTTVSGYGITDFNSLGDARWSLLAHTHTFSSLTSKPTTVSGYGITDVQALSRQTFSNTNVTVSASTTTLAQTGTMSANRTITLPAASGYTNGTGFVLIDESGTLMGTGNFHFDVVRAGSDTVNGGTSTVMVLEPIAYFQSDGTSKWVVNTDGNRFVDKQGRAHFATLSIGSTAGTIESLGNLDFFGIDGTSGVSFDFTNGNNDDNNFHIKGINMTQITYPFGVNGRGKITLADDNVLVNTNGYELQISLPTFTATRIQSWANGNGTIALTTNTSGVVDPTHGGTGSTSLGAGISTFLTTPTVANFKTALSDETTVVGNLLSLTNPSAISFIKIAADNTVSTRTPAQLASDISALSLTATGRVTAQSAANASIATYTNGGSDGSFEVSMNMNVTAVTVLSASLNCDYTDESNTARTMIFPVQSLAGNFVTGGLITATGPYETPVMHIRCKASTAITLYTSTGTYTGVTYTADGNIKQTK